MNTDILYKPIAFHRCFVPLTGSVNAALMLSQAMYWQKRNEDGVWWFQTQEKWADETGLSRREQETARRALRNLPFWKEELRGLPGKLHFFLDLELLLEIVTVGKTSLHKQAILHSTNQPYSDGGTSHTSSKVKESNEETYLSPPSAENENPDSESTNSKESLALAIYKSYPKKVSKKAALKAIIKAMDDHPFDYLLERTAKYAECTRAWPKSELKYIPNPATWFNAGSFEDDEIHWIKEAAVETFPQLSQKAFALRTAIQEHVANREYIGAVDNPTQEQFADLRELRSLLSEVESKMASIRK